MRNSSSRTISQGSVGVVSALHFTPTPEFVRMRMRKSYFSGMAKTSTSKPKIKWLRYVLVGVVGLGIYHVLNGPSGGINLWKLKQANAKEVKALDSLTAHKHDLEIEKRRLEKDSTYIEKVARKELGMSKPGEKVFRFVVPDSNRAAK